jgi:hypothetical protein
MHCSDSLLIPYSSYTFRRVYVMIREPSFVCRHSAVTIATPHHRCIYCHPDKAQILKRQCNQCYSDCTVGALKVLLTKTTGCVDSLTYTTIFTLM